ncbi:MAG: flavin reductase family protein [Hyphomicrobiales bacterium]|nr:flavin reductase family protein [Hyphomicrobiales bacterium]
MLHVDPRTRGQALVERFRAAMARTAAGVVIITTHGPAGRGGITVSSFCSVSLDPPSALACINRKSATLRLIEANGVFAANVLAQDQAALAAAFATAGATHEARFRQGVWRDDAPGGPLLKDAVAHFDCRLARTFDYGSHRIVIGDALDAASHEARPLIYAERGYHKLP